MVSVSARPKRATEQHSHHLQPLQSLLLRLAVGTAQGLAAGPPACVACQELHSRSRDWVGHGQIASPSRPPAGGVYGLAMGASGPISPRWQVCSRPDQTRAGSGQGKALLLLGRCCPTRARAVWSGPNQGLTGHPHACVARRRLPQARCSVSGDGFSLSRDCQTKLQPVRYALSLAVMVQHGKAQCVWLQVLLPRLARRLAMAPHYGRPSLFPRRVRFDGLSRWKSDRLASHANLTANQ